MGESQTFSIIKLINNYISIIKVYIHTKLWVPFLKLQLKIKTYEFYEEKILINISKIEKENQCWDHNYGNRDWNLYIVNENIIYIYYTYNQV